MRAIKNEEKKKKREKKRVEIKVKCDYNFGVDLQLTSWVYLF